MIIHSIFHSIDGEINAGGQGALSVFLRLAGCNLRCSYCDTQKAWEPDAGTEMSANEIKAEVMKYHPTKITLTGGEPLWRFGPELAELLEWFDNEGLLVTIETNGAIGPGQLLTELLERTSIALVMDYKLPSSGEKEQMGNGFWKWISPNHFSSRDWIKFVVADWVDFEHALQVVNTCAGTPVAGWAFSPSFGKLDPVVLINWMKEAREKGNLPAHAVFSYQLHKILYPNSQAEV